MARGRPPKELSVRPPDRWSVDPLETALVRLFTRVERALAEVTSAEGRLSLDVSDLSLANLEPNSLTAERVLRDGGRDRELIARAVHALTERKTHDPDGLQRALNALHISDARGRIVSAGDAAFALLSDAIRRQIASCVCAEAMERRRIQTGGSIDERLSMAASLLRDLGVHSAEGVLRRTYYDWRSYLFPADHPPKRADPERTRYATVVNQRDGLGLVWTDLLADAFDGSIARTLKLPAYR